MWTGFRWLRIGSSGGIFWTRCESVISWSPKRHSAWFGLWAQVETCCSTYGPDVFVVVYSVVDRSSLAVAEDMLLFLWKGGFVASRGVILAGNKADLERRREVPMPGPLTFILGWFKSQKNWETRLTHGVESDYYEFVKNAICLYCDRFLSTVQDVDAPAILGFFTYNGVGEVAYLQGVICVSEWISNCRIRTNIHSTRSGVGGVRVQFSKVMSLHFELWINFGSPYKADEWETQFYELPSVAI